MSPGLTVRAIALCVPTFALAAALVGCAGDGSTLPTAGGPPSTAFPPTLTDIQTNVFTPTCAVVGCHDAVTASGGLVLDAGTAHGNLVGVDSTGVPALHRVEAGDPDASYLMMKLDGAPGIVGERMPLGQPILPQDVRDAIRVWIADGALDN